MRIKWKLVLVSLLVSTSIYAENSYDQKYYDAGAINSKFEIINYNSYLNVTRMINNEFAKRLPVQADYQTTYTMVKLSSNGLRISLELDGINTKEDLEQSLDEALFVETIKNRICGQLPILQSNFFKKTTKGDVVYEINNSVLKNLKNYTVNYKDCLSTN